MTARQLAAGLFYIQIVQLYVLYFDISSDFSDTVSPFMVLEMFKKIEKEKEEALKQGQTFLIYFLIRSIIDKYYEELRR